MKISEMITLLGAGYKPADIKDISVLANEDSDIVTLASSVKNMDELKNLIELSKKEPDIEPEKPNDEPQEKDESKPLEDSKNQSQSEEITKLKDQIASLQEENRRRDTSGGKKESDEDLLKSLMQSCF